MSPRRSDVRERMIESTAMLLKRHGASGVSVGSVLEAAQAPRGSVYHHFPNGRNELLTEATTYAGGLMTSAIEHMATRMTPEEVVHSLVELWKFELTESEFRSGCPIVALAVESEPGDSELEGLIAVQFADWKKVIAQNLVKYGFDPQRAAHLAVMCIASVEGAIILCRAECSTSALDIVKAELTALLNQSVPV
ncbi:MAG: TetR/AcrR family transcriptional regulator [Mycobacteriaceae bacterium]